MEDMTHGAQMSCTLWKKQAKIEYITILGIFGVGRSGFGYYTFENLHQKIQNLNDYL